MKRKAIGKKLRFEVLKRDSFKCQYCGASAPDVLLKVDHIEPVFEGGTNDILNLITSCFDCNSGKGAVRISDQSMLEKTKQQLDELQHHRAQIEMMVEWKKSLKSKKQIELEQLESFWRTEGGGYILNEYGLNSLSCWLKKYTFEELLEAIQKSCASYLKLGDDGKHTKESAELAYEKIPSVCWTARMEKEDPGIKNVFYIRGILKRRFNIIPYRQHTLVSLIKPAIVAIGFETLKSVAQHCQSVSDFEDAVRISMQPDDAT